MAVHQVTDISSNQPELLEAAAKLLRNAPNKQKIFKAIYRGKSPVKYVTGLMKSTGLIKTRVLDAGGALAVAHICDQVKDKETGYKKIGFYQKNRDKILSLAENREKLEKLVTKRSPKLQGIVYKWGISKSQARKINVDHIAIDDIDSFSKVRSVKTEGFTKISESSFKNGIAKIVGQKDVPKDWGGEACDLFTDRLRYKGRRTLAAFAFKGPGKTGKLTPGKMGKNGDQIQRLSKCGVALFIIQYWRDIDQSVYEQLEDLLRGRSFYLSKKLAYCIIDGHDSARLIRAYPAAFKGKK